MKNKCVQNQNVLGNLLEVEDIQYEPVMFDRDPLNDKRFLVPITSNWDRTFAKLLSKDRIGLGGMDIGPATSTE